MTGRKRLAILYRWINRSSWFMRMTRTYQVGYIHQLSNEVTRQYMVGGTSAMIQYQATYHAFIAQAIKNRVGGVGRIIKL